MIEYEAYKKGFWNGVSFTYVPELLSIAEVTAYGIGIGDGMNKRPEKSISEFEEHLIELSNQPPSAEEIRQAKQEQYLEQKYS